MTRPCIDGSFVIVSGCSGPYDDEGRIGTLGVGLTCALLICGRGWWLSFG